ncbi:MAG: hypothetical protein ACMUEM_05555 [Flavobacteriales bacterium AspAUS03]
MFFIVLVRTGLGLLVLPWREVCQLTLLGALGRRFYYLLFYYRYNKEGSIPLLVVQYSWTTLISLLLVSI